MGHLYYYTELGNLGRFDPLCIERNPGEYGLQNTFPFQNLDTEQYWSGKEYATTPTYAWYFSLSAGGQSRRPKITDSLYGLALRNGQVVNNSIPTLNEWGLIIFSLLMAGSAFWFIRKEHHKNC